MLAVVDVMRNPAPAHVAMTAPLVVMTVLALVIERDLLRGKKLPDWVTLPFVPSAMRWKTPNMPCVHWQPKPMVRH
jgi:hypothetical protein